MLDPWAIRLYLCVKVQRLTEKLLTQLRCALLAPTREDKQQLVVEHGCQEYDELTVCKIILFVICTRLTPSCVVLLNRWNYGSYAASLLI